MELIVNFSTPQSSGFADGDFLSSPPKVSCSFLLFYKPGLKEEEDSKQKYLPSIANNYNIDILDRSLIPLNAREELSNLMSLARHALPKYSPELADEGVGGTYFIKDRKRNYIGVFKPGDEEPLALNNPKKVEDIQNKLGFRRGDYGYLREIGAYLIDRDNFSGVPPTTLVHCSHPSFQPMSTKIGSFQRFEKHDCASWDLGSAKFPIHEVHKIAVLDLRIVNCDRHGGNILVRKCEDGNITLIPIDHGFSLPDSFEDVWFEWFPWTQTKRSFDDETKRYIESIDIEDDVRTLRGLGIREECLKNLRISTMWLKKGAKADLTLHQIAGALCQKGSDQLSVIEKVIRFAVNQRLNFFEMISQEMDRVIQQMKQK